MAGLVPAIYVLEIIRWRVAASVRPAGQCQFSELCLKPILGRAGSDPGSGGLKSPAIAKIS